MDIDAQIAALEREVAEYGARRRALEQQQAATAGSNAAGAGSNTAGANYDAELASNGGAAPLSGAIAGAQSAQSSGDRVLRVHT